MEPWQLFGQQVAATRVERKWSVRKLAERVAEHGFDGPSEKRISHIEAGSKIGAQPDLAQRAENIRLREVLALAAALGPALPNLLASTAQDREIELGDRTLKSRDYRAWLMGYDCEQVARDSQDRELYYEKHVPTFWADNVRIQARIHARPDEAMWLTLSRQEVALRRKIITQGTIESQGDFAGGENNG